jgi:hypothetical protein
MNRVKVFDGSGKNLLGYGNYVGNVTVYFWYDDKGNILSNKNAEQPFTEEEISVIGVDNIFTIEDNPKIELDNGCTVYGCQVWWNFVE